METRTPSATPGDGTADRRLSEFERVTKVFYSPSETFEDIRRNSRWLVPLLLMIVLSVIYAFSVGKKVGWETAAANQMKLAPPARLEQMEKLSPEQRETQQKIAEKFTTVISYGFPVIILLGVAIFAGLYLLVMNFGLGAGLSYSKVFSMLMYAGLVRGIWSILAIVGLWTFLDPADFQIQMPLATSPAAFISAADHPFLFRLGQSLDVFVIWSTILTGIGLAVLSKKSKSTCMIVAFGVLIVWSLLLSATSLF